MTLCDLIALFSFLAKANFKMFRCASYIRGTMAYMCLNMIKFDAVDFSESRSEEVISFF